PSIMCCRAKDSIDYGHVVNRIFEWNRLRTVFAQRSRKHRSLNLILIANWNLDRLGARARQILAVVDQNSSRSIVRRVEGDQYFDSALSADEDHSLIRREASATGKCRLTLRKVEHRTGQSVSAKSRIAFNQTEYAVWFGVKHKARDRDRITTDVHQGAAAEL